MPRAKVADALSGVTIKPIQVRTPVSATADTKTAGRAAATPVTLFSQGSLTIYGKCFREAGTPDNPGTIGEIYIASTADGVIYDSDHTSSSNGFLDPDSPEVDRVLFAQGSYAGPGNPGTLNISDVQHSAIYAVAPDVTVQAQLILGTKVGNPPAGNGVFGPGDVCIFRGTVTAY